MQRVIVIGCPGSGKSTFSRALHSATGLPLYHLDMMKWTADGSFVPGHIFMERLNSALEKDAWIIDGNYASTMELRMQSCDTVFFLDFPTDVCLAGVKSRKGQKRSDIPCATLEDEDREFVESIRNYNSVNRPAVMELLRRYSHKRIIIFRDRNEAGEFLSDRKYKENHMNAQEIIEYIGSAEKKTPVRLYVKERGDVDYGAAKVFGAGDKIVFGDWRELGPIIEANRDKIEDIVIENDCRNSAIPLLDMKDVPARIEPGAVIREQVEIGKNAVIMMGAVINIGAVIGEGTMIDMGAILGGRATVGKNCHVGAGAVLAGVIEPASATPVIIEDGVLIGANAVVIEGVHVGKNAVVAAGAVVIEDVPDGTVVAGCPARVIKVKDEGTTQKTALEAALRKL